MWRRIRNTDTDSTDEKLLKRGGNYLGYNLKLYDYDSQIKLILFMSSD